MRICYIHLANKALTITLVLGRHKDEERHTAPLSCMKGTILENELGAVQRRPGCMLKTSKIPSVQVSVKLNFQETCTYKWFHGCSIENAQTLHRLFKLFLQTRIFSPIHHTLQISAYKPLTFSYLISTAFPPHLRKLENISPSYMIRASNPKGKAIIYCSSVRRVRFKTVMSSHLQKDCLYTRESLKNTATASGRPETSTVRLTPSPTNARS